MLFSSMDPVEVALAALKILKTTGNSNSFQEDFSKHIFALRSKLADPFVKNADEVTDLLDEIDEKCRLSKKNQISRDLICLIRFLRPVDSKLLVDILKKNMLTAGIL